eukprot:m.142494 g.142494  ORF g.142494 m.142494 type:complete len:298 (+) comp22926_c0_seq2:70-963(+)
MARAPPQAAPPQNAIVLNMVAASTCISAAVVLFNPVDCWRIRWQVQTRHPTMRAHLASILRSEGVMAGLWIPGVGCNAVGAALCRGIGLGCYPSVRDWIVGPGGEKGGGAMFLAGLISGGIGYGLSTPLWQCKTVLQAGVETRRPLYKNGLDGLVQIAKAGGVRGLYRGASALIVRGALMNAGNTLGYDFTKTFARRNDIAADGQALHITASVVAAFLSSTFSVPADVVMTRYQSAELLGTSYSGVLDCAVSLGRESGPGAFFRGWTPLFVRVAPLYVLYLPAYEQLRKAFGLGYLQ